MMTQESNTIAALEALIERAEIISFDFFDTLFVRPLCHPEDAFDVLGKRFSIPNFRSLRKIAQTRAFQHMHEKGRKEITLEDIYEYFPESAVPSATLMQAEYDLELTLVSPNPELISFFDIALKHDKRVVVTSDMYLTEEFFFKAFDKYGLEHVPMFISASQNATKRDSGELFDVLAECMNVPRERILHIGDNEHADVVQARAKNIRAYHYVPERQTPARTQLSPEASLASGLIRLHGNNIAQDSAAESGFLFGGPANFAFLRWIEQQARIDDIDHVLFISRDGYLMSKVVKRANQSDLPKSCYFLGSRIAFTLAAMTEENFESYLPFLISGADGLSPYELLERIGVPAPAADVMKSFGLSDDSRIDLAETAELQRFLCAYRWEILKICRRNRRGLFEYLLELGLENGQNVAIVDVGWSGSTQEAFESALNGLMDLNIYGYYFCLAETPEGIERRTRYRMKALFSAGSVDNRVIDKIYKNRVLIETFFSAPHDTVIGFECTSEGVLAIEDPGRGTGDKVSAHVRELIEGGQMFFEAYSKLLKEVELPLDCLSIASPIIEFAVSDDWHQSPLFLGLSNFDTWASSKNRSMNPKNYV